MLLNVVISVSATSGIQTLDLTVIIIIYLLLELFIVTA